jgi:hypothetical protein
MLGRLPLNFYYMIWFQEADRFRAEEQKSHSSSAQTNRDNMKLKCSNVIDTLVKKAVQGMYSYCTICFQCSVKSPQTDSCARWFKSVDISETDFISISMIRVLIWFNTQPTWIVYHYHAGAYGRSQIGRASGWPCLASDACFVCLNKLVTQAYVINSTWSAPHYWDYLVVTLFLFSYSPSSLCSLLPHPVCMYCWI